MAQDVHRIRISDDLVLDFSTPGRAEEPAETIYKPLEQILAEAEKPPEEHAESPEGEQIEELYLEAQAIRKAYMQSVEVYKAYNENCRKTEQLRKEILTGAKEGKDPCVLFLKAVKTIALLTQDNGFLHELEEDVRAIYGVGLDYKQPLQSELQGAQERLQRLSNALAGEKDTNTREHLQRAIKAHNAEIEELQLMLAR